MNQKGVAKILVIGLVVLLLLGFAGAVKKRQSASNNLTSNQSTKKNVVFCPKQDGCIGKSSKIKNIKMLQQEGVRPRFSPDGQMVVFDRKNADGYYDLYISNLQGVVTKSLTENRPPLANKNSGNGVFDKSGEYIIFISEESDHFASNAAFLGDPGIGLFSNLWATDVEGKNLWKLTNIQIKKNLLDKIPAIATVNPHFSKDGQRLIWTERYAEGGNYNWGKWRIKQADFSVNNGIPKLSNERVLFTPAKGNYVTFMEELSSGELILSGNLDGQHEFGMDQYRYNPQTGALTNLTNTPEFWEEDSSLTGAGQIVYMTNQDSNLKLDFNNGNWAAQPIERDYYIMNPDGSGKERLTYFNDPTAPEYLGKRVLAVAADISPDGKTMVSTIGIDYGDKRRDVVLALVLIQLAPGL